VVDVNTTHNRLQMESFHPLHGYVYGHYDNDEQEDREDDQVSSSHSQTVATPDLGHASGGGTSSSSCSSSFQRGNSSLGYGSTSTKRIVHSTELAKWRNGADRVKISAAIEKLTWNDSEFLWARTRGDYGDNNETMSLFDKLCRLMNIQLILQEPHIWNIQTYEGILKEHLLFREDTNADNDDPLAVVSLEFFTKWFRAKNKSSTKASSGSSDLVSPLSGRGLLLYQSYRNMRNSIFRNWENIFWRPSPAMTSTALLWCDPSITSERFICPSHIVKLPHIFGMCGRKLTEDQGRLTLSIDKYIDTEDNCVHNPFLSFIRSSQRNLQNLLLEVNKLREVMRLTDSEDVNRSILEKELPENGTVEKLLLQMHPLSKLLSEIAKWIQFAKGKQLAVGEAEKQLLHTRQFFETTQMHIFLAAWTLWDFPGQPYFVDILRHMNTLAEYQMLLTEDFLGTFYMVRQYV
jgi:hypothetical protein